MEKWSLNRWEERQVLRDLKPKKPGGPIPHDTVFVTIGPDKAIKQIGLLPRHQGRAGSTFCHVPIARLTVVAARFSR